MTRKNAYLALGNLLPSVVTIIGLSLGITAIKCAMYGRISTGIVLVLIGIFLDGLDGRIARKLSAETNFGAQLDSLADLVTCGIAPGILIYVCCLRDVIAFGWSATMIYSVLIACRLAKFNVDLNDEGGEYWEKHFFFGVPSPAAAILILNPCISRIYEGSSSNLMHWIGFGAHSNEYLVCYVVVVAFLAASRIPTISCKHVIIRRDWLPVFFCTIGLMIVFAIARPFMIIYLISNLYLLSIPMSAFVYYWMKRKKV